MKPIKILKFRMSSGMGGIGENEKLPKPDKEMEMAVFDVVMKGKGSRHTVYIDLNDEKVSVV